MSIQELNPTQLEQVKQRYYIEKQEEAGEPVSFGDLIQIDELVSDEEVFDAYSGTVFTEDDFFS